MKTTSIANAVTKPVENTAKSKKRICFAFIPALLLAGAYAAKIIFPFNFSFYLTELIYMWGWFILALLTLAKKSNWLIIGGVFVAVLLPKFLILLTLLQNPHLSAMITISNRPLF